MLSLQDAQQHDERLRNGEKQQGHQQEEFEEMRKLSIEFQDLELSQVIATNQPIDIKCEEERPFEHFYNGMNDLDQYTNQITNKNITSDQTTPTKYFFKERNGELDMIETESPINRYSQIPIKLNEERLRKALQYLSEKVFELDGERITIIDYLHEIREKFELEVRKNVRIWESMLLSLHNSYENNHKTEVSMIIELQGELEERKNRMEKLQIAKNNICLQEVRLKQRLEDLQEVVRKLNGQVSHHEAQNQQLRYEIGKFHEYELKLSHYEQQISNLNYTIEQNSEYIFDLQQKVANSNFQLLEKEKRLKQQYEIQTQQLKEKIEQNYSVEFERVQEEIRQRVMEEVYQQYHTYSIEMEELKRQLQEQSLALQQQMTKHEHEINNLQNEKLGLIEQNREYEVKLHELQQFQLITKSKAKNQDKLKIEQLLNKLRDLQDKHRDKDVQLNYYKSLQIRTIEQSSPLDMNTFRSKRSGNILLMEQSILNKSILKQSAISPSSGINQKYGKSRQDLINNILSRIKMRQEGSNISQLHENSFESSDLKKTMPSTLRPVSPESILLQKEKDVRMRNISSKLQKLKTDIRREIGMMKN